VRKIFYSKDLAGGAQAKFFRISDADRKILISRDLSRFRQLSKNNVPRNRLCGSRSLTSSAEYPRNARSDVTRTWCGNPGSRVGASNSRVFACCGLRLRCSRIERYQDKRLRTGNGRGRSAEFREDIWASGRELRRYFRWQRKRRKRSLCWLGRYAVRTIHPRHRFPAMRGDEGDRAYFLPLDSRDNRRR
jgi:hypothetical protein